MPIENKDNGTPAPEPAPRSVSQAPVSFDLSRLTNVDKVVGVASLVALIALFLPWYTASISGFGYSIGGSTDATYYGWMWVEFLVALALIGYLVATTAWGRLISPAAHGNLLAIGTAVQLLLVLIAFFDKPDSGIPGLSIGWGFGAFIGLAAAIVAGQRALYSVVRAYVESHTAVPPSA